MNEIADSEAAARDLWQLIPLECLLGGFFVLVAAGLRLAGLMP